MSDDLHARTAEAFDDPQVGDRFHEMYSYWMYVIGIDGEKITTFESGHHPSQHPMRGKCCTYPTREAFRAQFGYKSIPGSWMTLDRRGFDVADWMKLPKLTVRINQVAAGDWRWRCDCHDRVSTPWPVRPTELNAQAEHDLLVGEAASS